MVKPNAPKTSPLLSETLPEFARELEQALREDGQPTLADQIVGLRIVDRCRCGDHFCATFDTMPLATGAWSDLGQHECVVVDAVPKGMVILDLVDRQIGSVEVLYRHDVREKLLAVIP